MPATDKKTTPSPASPVWDSLVSGFFLAAGGFLFYLAVEVIRDGEEEVQEEDE